VSLDAPRSAIFRTANLAVGGDLKGWLAERRERGDSYQDIAFELRRAGIVVSWETVRSWYLRLTAA